MILYSQNPKDFYKRAHRNNRYSKMAGDKISTQKSIAFLYANNKIEK